MIRSSRVQSSRLVLQVALVAVIPSTLTRSASAAAPDPSTVFQQVFHAPVIQSLDGGLRSSGLHFTNLTIGAYPLASPPVNGFAAQVAVSLTNQEGDDDLNFAAIPQSYVSGNTL